jgi:hypothetical protein
LLKRLGRKLIRRLRRVGIAGGRPTARTYFPQISIEAPAVPTGLREPGEHLEIRPLAQRLDARVDLVGLSAVFTPRRSPAVEQRFYSTIRSCVSMA